MLILASQSPRRRDLLTAMGLSFRAAVSNADETPPENADPAAAACAIALSKASAVRKNCSPDDFIIGADTSVVIDGKVFGKPADETDAARMLHLLSGRLSTVVTGIAVLHGNEMYTDSVETRVFFRSLTETEIAAYIATGEPLDKAGAYGIQGLAAWFIDRIEGDYYNVVGLPLCALGKLLEKAGYRVWGENSCEK